MAQRCLLASLTTWVWFLGPTWWKERPGFTELPSELHIHAVTFIWTGMCGCVHMYIHTCTPVHTQAHGCTYTSAQLHVGGYTCICVYNDVCIFVYMCVYVCAGQRRCLDLFPWELCFLKWGLLLSRSLPNRLDWQAVSPRDPWSFFPQLHGTRISVHCYDWLPPFGKPCVLGSSLDPHSCKASTLPTELSPQLGLSLEPDILAAESSYLIHRLRCVLHKYFSAFEHFAVFFQALLFE